MGINMNCSLFNHTNKYNLSISDCLLSVATGLSGAPYAIRHYQQSNKTGESKLGHRIICGLEFIPIVGGIIALIECIIVYITQKAPLIITPKTLKNTRKAIEEHQLKDKVYATLEEALPSEEELTKKEKKPLQFSHAISENIGYRTKMEDARFYTENKQDLLTGIFDGHGGPEVSNYANEEFKNRFSQTLEEENGDVRKAFVNLIDKIHYEVAKKKEWNDIGSTAVICFIDQKTHLIYTATLGDSEANIYRKVGTEMKSIPLSCVRDWSSKKDALRMSKAFGLPWIASQWPTEEPKGLRSRIFIGVNVSRAIGDISETGKKEKPIVIHKPKITVNKLKSKDILVLACDGLKDFLTPESKIVAIINQILEAGSKSLAGSISTNLVYAALRNMKKGSSDNVTVVAIEVA